MPMSNSDARKRAAEVPIIWEPGTIPTAEQFRDWFISCSPTQQLLAASAVLKNAEAVGRCFMEAHEPERVIRERMAAAWDEGHYTRQQLGPDGCTCAAWSENECACGLYGSNVITPNPYKADPC